MNMSNSEKCVIWGVGKGGQNTYDLLKTINTIDIVGFCDNDKQRHGEVFNDLPVLDEKDIDFDFDYFVIGAPSYENEIYDQLLGITDKPIFKNIEELINKRFSVDISGWYNAKCKWCSTGRKNLENQAKQQYMSADLFKSIYTHMRNIKLLHPYNEMLLYSWGEPFLNPDYKEIIHFLYSKRQIFSLSTNASVPKYIDGDEAYYKYCKTVVFSMPGFSQESYDRIHGFKLEVIKKNIMLLLDNMRMHGFEGDAYISYHAYQFNENELKSAKEFAEELGIGIEPVSAYFASYELTEAYLENRLSNECLTEAKRELFLDHVKDLIKKRPEGYKCLMENMVSIHWDGRIELCCCVDDNAESFLWENILNIKNLREWKSYREKMLKSYTCNKCRKLGMDYWLFNNPMYEENM